MFVKVEMFEEICVEESTSIYRKHVFGFDFHIDFDCYSVFDFDFD